MSGLESRGGVGNGVTEAGAPGHAKDFVVLGCD